MTDYEESGGVRSLINMFRNDHQDGTVLPAEWKEAYMPFRRFTGCRSNSRQTTLPVLEAKGTIKYGPGRQHDHPASVYAPKEGESAKETGRVLRSRIFAKSTEQGDPQINFYFTAEVSKQRTFVYEAWAIGAGKPLNFTVPELAALWKRYGSEQKAEPTKRWEERDGIFVAPMNVGPVTKEGKGLQKNTFEFTWPRDVKFAERAMQVNIVDRSTREPIEGGLVSVYVPVPKGSR